jgi:hypothetical protein
VEEDNYFFRLSRYAEPLRRSWPPGPCAWCPSRGSAGGGLCRGADGLQHLAHLGTGARLGTSRSGDASQVVYV